MIVIIDNYDSFTYNLLQPLADLDQDIRIFRNDALSLEELATLNPGKIIISSGPGTVENTGISLEVIRKLGKSIPVLGISLGHHCIAQASGASLIPSAHLMHGKNTQVFHDNHPLFNDVPSPFVATCYHSQVIDPASLTEDLEVIARQEDGTIMGIAHRQYPLTGLQFHPESIESTFGQGILHNFVRQQ
jgi:anthranilate synthase/aminodeoxychorismate synthase-like glutamine amidotransferase